MLLIFDATKVFDHLTIEQKSLLFLKFQLSKVKMEVDFEINITNEKNYGIQDNYFCIEKRESFAQSLSESKEPKIENSLRRPSMPDNRETQSTGQKNRHRSVYIAGHRSYLTPNIHLNPLSESPLSPLSESPH